MISSETKELNISNNLVSITDFCEMLSISKATAKNWIRLNKIKPSISRGSVIFFTKDYVESIINQLGEKQSYTLKSRRNKKFISGSHFYNDYISDKSQNINVIRHKIEFIKDKNLNFSVSQIKYIIADCTIQLMVKSGKFGNFSLNSDYLNAYLENNISFKKYNNLIEDFIDNRNDALKFIKNYPEVLNTKYVYEKNEDILGLLYISLSNLNKRKSLGAYYTPSKIIQRAIGEIKADFTGTTKILDPCCGSGNFLLNLPDNLSIEQIYGNDIDSIAINIARVNMALKFKTNNPDILYKNFTNKNFLSDDLKIKYDYIIGNPPWGANYSQKELIDLKNKYLCAKDKNVESYDIFIEKSLSSLNSDGNMLFVLPEAILSVKSHKVVRNIILKKSSIRYLEFLGNIFDNVQCPSIILRVQYTNSSLVSTGIRIVEKNRKYLITGERVLKPDELNIFMDDEEYSIYQKILNEKDKVYLKNNAIFALGIVTGNNKKYVSKEKTDFNEVILKGSDITKFKINDYKYYIDYKPEDFQQVAPEKYYRAKEKLLYRFISKKLIFAYDNKQILSLNSCNILIPQIRNMNIKYVLAILNSRIAQFIFEKKYKTLKVLRSHIENIPIPLCDAKLQNKIVKFVDDIIINPADKKLYEILETEIRKLYNLSEKEYIKIKKSLN